MAGSLPSTPAMGARGLDLPNTSVGDANTTPVHAHAVLFGVYRMLGLGLTLMGLRALRANREWKEGVLGMSFWTINGGLMAMILLSLRPVGLLRTVASVKHGYWYPRRSDLGQGFMQTLR